MHEAPAVNLAALIDEARTLALRNATLLSLVVAAIAGSFTGIDWYIAVNPDANGVLLLNSLFGLVISLFVQYRVTEQMLADRWPSDRARPTRSYGALFGLSLLSGLAIAAGLIVLVVPGIYLAGRWLTAVPRLVENELSGSDALRAAWADSAHSDFVFAIAYLISLSPLLAAVALGFAMEGDVFLDSFTMLASVIFNLANGLFSVLGWVLAVAAFRLCVPVRDQTMDVFA